MSKNKQSSVEWYRQEIMKILFDSSDNTLIYEIDIFNKAKAMHKEEIEDANFYGQRLHAKSVTNTMMEDNAEQYYNETYGGNK